MFSKKITNDGNDTSPTSKTSKFKNRGTDNSNDHGFWAYRRSHSESENKKTKIWLNANKALNRKYKIVIAITSFLGIGGFLALEITGEVLKKQYLINYEQVKLVHNLAGNAKDAMPTFIKYKSATPPDPQLSVKTVAAINKTFEYLKMFQYINDSNDDFIITNFNAWVQQYQQWPQHSNETTNLKTKDKYIETLDSLVSLLTIKENVNIPLAHMNDMSKFAQTLHSIDMNIYATFDWFNAAHRLTSYALIPLGATAVVLTSLMFWMYKKQKKWFREHPSELEDLEKVDTNNAL